MNPKGQVHKTQSTISRVHRRMRKLAGFQPLRFTRPPDGLPSDCYEGISPGPCGYELTFACMLPLALQCGDIRCEA